jgi:LuxR family maltose regulon positive regulatory protein
MAPELGPPLGESGSALFRSKLRAPATPEHLVRRPRLLELVGEATRAPLALIEGPAGAGKTSLMADWTAGARIPTAWLTLDEFDRDGRQFWTGVVAALQTIVPGIGKQALAVLRRPNAVNEAVGTLLEALETEGLPVAVLVVDNAHHVDGDDETAESLRLFVHHLPPWLHLVLVTRRTPRLPIDRLRARGHLGEVHFVELCFSPDEAEQMLSLLAPTLSADKVTAVAARAGGWAAGIQLAALAERSARALPQPVGDRTREDGDLLVEDYIWREAFAGESPDLLAVLVDTAVVERVNSDLALALTGRVDAGELLAQAEARGLFTSRIGPAGWFEVHSLVREVMSAELRRKSPARLAEQHARAARWFEDAGEVLPALEHWLQAGRPADALRLLSASSAALYDSGREATIERILTGIPLSVARADLESLIEFAWCNLLVDRTRFLAKVDQVVEWVNRSPDVSPATRGRTRMLCSVAATMQGDWAAGGRLARDAMAELGDSTWQDFLGRFAWNMVARDVALSQRWDDSGAEVSQVRGALGRDRERHLAFEGSRALGEVLAGRPVDALRVAAGVRRAATVANMTILRTELSVAEAMAHRELGDRSEAIFRLTALAETRTDPIPYAQLLALLDLTEAWLHEGDLQAAERSFGQAAELVETQCPGPGAAPWLARVGTLVALAREDLDEARRWCERTDDPFWHGVGLSRVSLAAQDAAAAAAALASAAPRCVRHEVVLGLLSARVARTPDEAGRHASAAVHRAASVGLLQTVAAEGHETIRLVERAAWSAPGPWLDRLRRAMPSPGTAYTGRIGPVDGLTDRELAVLRLLPSRLTLREIADELSISPNTLKFHLKLIYRKLGVGSRAEAVESARAMSAPRRHLHASRTLLR